MSIGLNSQNILEHVHIWDRNHRQRKNPAAPRPVSQQHSKLDIYRLSVTCWFTRLNISCVCVVVRSAQRNALSVCSERHCQVFFCFFLDLAAYSNEDIFLGAILCWYVESLTGSCSHSEGKVFQFFIKKHSHADVYSCFYLSLEKQVTYLQINYINEQFLLIKTDLCHFMQTFQASPS